MSMNAPDWNDECSEHESETSSTSRAEALPVATMVKMSSLRPKCEILIQREAGPQWPELEWHEYRRYEGERGYMLTNRYHKSEDLSSLIDWGRVDFQGISVDDVNYFDGGADSIFYHQNAQSRI